MRLALLHCAISGHTRPGQHLCKRGVRARLGGQEERARRAAAGSSSSSGSGSSGSGSGSSACRPACLPVTHPTPPHPLPLALTRSPRCSRDVGTSRSSCSAPSWPPVSSSSAVGGASWHSRPMASPVRLLACTGGWVGQQAGRAGGTKDRSASTQRRELGMPQRGRCDRQPTHRRFEIFAEQNECDEHSCRHGMVGGWLGGYVWCVQSNILLHFSWCGNRLLQVFTANTLPGAALPAWSAPHHALAAHAGNTRWQYTPAAPAGLPAVSKKSSPMPPMPPLPEGECGCRRGFTGRCDGRMVGQHGGVGTWQGLEAIAAASCSCAQACMLTPRAGVP